MAVFLRLLVRSGHRLRAPRRPAGPRATAVAMDPPRKPCQVGGVQHLRPALPVLQESVRRSNIRLKSLGSGFWGRGRMGIRRRIVVGTFLAALAGLAWPAIGSPAAGAETQPAACTADGTA